MPAPMKRSEAKEQIRAAIIARLEAELGTGNRLEGIEGVHDGERVRLVPELPALFLIRENETVTQQRIHQTMDYELSILAMAAGDDPDLVLNESEKWAAEATAIVTAAPRNLGLPFVNDCKFVRSVPVSGPHTDGRRAATVDVIVVTYTILQQ